MSALPPASFVIGASVIPCIVGIDPFKTPEQLFRQMLGLEPPEPRNEHMARGTHLEPGLCSWWCELAGAERCEARFAASGAVLGNGQLQVWHPEHRWARATPDIIAEANPIRGGFRCLIACDVKAPSSTRKKQGDVWVDTWNESQQIAPAHYVCQSTFQQGVLLAAGVPVATGELAAGPAWGKLIRVGVPFDAEYFAELISCAERFRACLGRGELSQEFKTKEQS